MKIALSMMDQAWENKPANRDTCEEFAAISSKNRVDLLIFPEMTLTGFTLATSSIAEEINTSESLCKFSEMAAQYKLGVVAGLVLKASNSYHNCAVAFGKSGERLSCYEKIHPFSIAGEDRYVSGGAQLATFELDGLTFGLTICYDLRFPLLWYSLANKCDCIINIANWPARRIDHWKTLLKARAIENQVYVIGVNRVGVDGNNLEYTESSIAFAPEGAEVAPVITDENLRVIEIEKNKVKKCQDTFPVRNDRRHVLYSKFLSESARS